MFPYFTVTTIQIGPLTIYVWGLMIVLGILACLWILKFEARARQLPYDLFLDLTAWILAAAFAGARLAHALFYEPAFFWAHPEEILQVWHGGLASTGGIIVGVVVGVGRARRLKLPFIASADAVARCLPVAWVIGRLGCYFTHMHPGRLANTWFAVAYPGGARLDLGLVESFVWLLIGVAFWIFPRAKKSGTYAVAILLFYPVARFALDFFRATDLVMSDRRYFGLTPAQYAMIILFALGVCVAARLKLFKKYDA